MNRRYRIVVVGGGVTSNSFPRHGDIGADHTDLATNSSNLSGDDSSLTSVVLDRNEARHVTEDRSQVAVSVPNERRLNGESLVSR